MTVYTTERGLYDLRLNHIGKVSHEGFCRLFEEADRGAGIPERLVHYTTMHGMTSIVENQSIYASHPRYLNDYAETQEISELYTRARGWTDPHANSNPFWETLDSLMARSPVPNYYVACFCRNDDLLSQWRGYGKGVAPPYALTFDRLELSSMAARGEETTDLGGHPTMLWPVVYDKAVKERIFISVLEASVEAWESGTSDDADWADACAEATRAALGIPSALFKNEAFREEDEWRLIFVRDNGEALRGPFRETEFGLCPYVKIRNRERLPLIGVRQGPTAYPDDARRSATAFVRSHGYDFDVTASTATVR